MADGTHGWADLQGNYTPKRGPYFKPEDSHDAFCRASNVTVTDASGKVIATVNAMTGERRGVAYNGTPNLPLGMATRRTTQEESARRMTIARNAGAKRWRNKRAKDRAA